jgi:two-component system nitrate/nitrite response regulator NarL
MRLVLCDDNRLLGEALAFIFQERGHDVIAVTTCASEGIAAVAEHHPDVCLLDLGLPDGSGLDAAREMRQRHPETEIVILSCLTDSAAVSEARKIGVAGFLRKDQRPSSVVSALEAVAAGGTAFDPKLLHQPRRMATEHAVGVLTARETEVLRRIVEGQSTRQMASGMDITSSTLRGYVKSIFAKLGVHSRLQAAAIASGSHDRSVA